MWPISIRFSCAESLMSMLCAWKTTPILRRTSAGSRATSCPMIKARPPDGSILASKECGRLWSYRNRWDQARPKISAGRTSNRTTSQRGAIAVLMAKSLQLDDGRLRRDGIVDGGLVESVGNAHRRATIDSIWRGKTVPVLTEMIEWRRTAPPEPKAG